jgi:hypothetical protein
MVTRDPAYFVRSRPSSQVSFGDIILNQLHSVLYHVDDFLHVDGLHLRCTTTICTESDVEGRSYCIIGNVRGQMIPQDEAHLVRLPGVLFLCTKIIFNPVVNEEVPGESVGRKGRVARVAACSNGAAAFTGAANRLHHCQNLSG